MCRVARRAAPSPFAEYQEAAEVTTSVPTTCCLAVSQTMPRPGPCLAPVTIAIFVVEHAHLLRFVPP